MVINNQVAKFNIEIAFKRLEKIGLANKDDAQFFFKHLDQIARLPAPTGSAPLQNQQYQATHVQEAIELLNTRKSDLANEPSKKLMQPELLTDFRGLDLKGFDFSGRDLRNADFRSASLQGANFAGANLANANFAVDELVMQELIARDDIEKFRNNFLERANFEGANLQEASFINAAMEGANLNNIVPRFFRPKISFSLSYS